MVTRRDCTVLMVSHYLLVIVRIGLVEGVAAYVRNDLAVTELCSYTNQQVSTYWFLMQQPGSTPIIFCTAYIPPALPKKKSDDTLEHDISTLAKSVKQHKSAKIFLCGDFNDFDTSEMTNLFPLEQIVTFPTREDRKLDLIFMDIEEYIATACIKEPPILTNDHCAITMPSTNRIPKPKYQAVIKRMITPQSKIAITQELAGTNWACIYKENNVNKKAELFHTKICDIYDKHCLERKVRAPVGKPIITSPLIRKLSRAKRSAYNKNNRDAWKYLAKQLAEEQKNVLHKQTNQNINNAIKGTKAWWHNIRKLTGEIPTRDDTPALYIEERWHSSNEFAQKLNEFYLQDHNKSDFPEIPSSGISLHVTEEDTFKLLEKINTTKSTSTADFPSWISKNNSHLLCAPVSNIINAVLSSGTYPKLWKAAEVTPIKKTKTPTQFKDMRPISLLFHLGKVTEKVIVHHLWSELPTLPNQFAYTPSLGTTDAVVKFTTDIINALDNRDTVGVRALLLDFSKAFDKMQP